VIIMQNIFSAGQDSMLDFLAKRDLDQQKTYDREDARADKQRSFENQERQLANAELNTQFNQERLTAQDAEKVTERKAKDDRVANLIKVVTDGNAAPEVRQQAGLQLDALGVSASAIGGVLNPKPEKPTSNPVMRVNPRTGKVEQIGEAPVGAHFVQEPAPPKPTKDPNAVKDNANLPQGVVDYLDTFLTKDHGGSKPYTLDEAYAEVSGNWGKLKAAHPHLDAGAVKTYLLKSFPQDQMTGVRHGTVVNGQPPSATPANVPAPQASGGVKVMAPTGEVRVRTPAEAQADVARGAKIVP
jgi:hypothetical protein